MNLTKNYMILSRLQLITRRTKGVSPSKNSPGKIITFYSAKRSLQKSSMLAMIFWSNFSVLMTMVAYRAPEDFPHLQYDSP